MVNAGAVLPGLELKFQSASVIFLLGRQEFDDH